MKARQIFVSYPFKEEFGSVPVQYCPLCGHNCEQRKESGRVRPICPKCGWVYYKNPSPGVSVLIVKDGRVLLCKRGAGNFQSGKWCLPCGFIEFDEDYLTAARREVREETGLDVEITSIINVTYNFLSPQVHSLVVVLLAQISGGDPQAGDDIEALQWVPVTGPFPDMAFAADEMIIQQYKEKGLKGIPIG